MGSYRGSISIGGNMTCKAERKDINIVRYINYVVIYVSETQTTNLKHIGHIRASVIPHYLIDNTSKNFFQGVDPRQQ